VFLDSVCDETSALPVQIRQNIANIGVFVMSETFSLMTNPRPKQLVPLININRELAAGLRSNA
jgi:flagellar protein FlaF